MMYLWANLAARLSLTVVFGCRLACASVTKRPVTAERYLTPPELLDPLDFLGTSATSELEPHHARTWAS